jgi:hypothetical protein
MGRTALQLSFFTMKTRRHRTRRDAALALGLGLLGVATPAFAYLDPSTGSMIISAIVGMFATLGLALKTYWYKLKALFRGRAGDPGTAPASTDRGAASAAPPPPPAD